MKRDELQDIWKQANYSIKNKSQQELNNILETKMKSIMKKHFLVNYISITVGLIVVTLLIIACVKRSYDTYYVINNIMLCLITSLFVATGIYSYYKMNYNKLELPLKDWLKYRIDTITKHQKTYPIRYVFAVFMILPYYLSFSVYFMNRPLINVITNEQFHFSFLIVFISGSLSALFAIRNIRLYNKKILKSLENLYLLLCDNKQICKNVM